MVGSRIGISQVVSPCGADRYQAIPPAAVVDPSSKYPIEEFPPMSGILLRKSLLYSSRAVMLTIASSADIRMTGMLLAYISLIG